MGCQGRAPKGCGVIKAPHIVGHQVDNVAGGDVADGRTAQAKHLGVGVAWLTALTTSLWHSLWLFCGSFKAASWLLHGCFMARLLCVDLGVGDWLMDKQCFCPPATP